MMGGMVAVQFFNVAALVAGILVLAALVVLYMWWHDEGERAAQRSRARHTALQASAADERDDVELSA